VDEGNWKLVGHKDKGQFLGSLSEPNPEVKNYLKTNPEVVERLEALHKEWAEDVQPKR